MSSDCFGKVESGIRKQQFSKGKMKQNKEKLRKMPESPNVSCMMGISLRCQYIVIFLKKQKHKNWFIILLCYNSFSWVCKWRCLNIGVMADFGTATGSQFRAADTMFEMIMKWWKFFCLLLCKAALISLGYQVGAGQCLAALAFSGSIQWILMGNKAVRWRLIQ